MLARRRGRRRLTRRVSAVLTLRVSAVLALRVSAVLTLRVSAVVGVSLFPAAADTVTELFSRYPETCPVHLREALGVTAEPRRFDTVILGRRTHAPAVAAGLAGGAYPHLRQILVTHHEDADSAGTEVVTGDIVAHVRALKAEPGRDVWLCGGADVAGQLVDLIDEIQLKINPILLGDGIPLVRAGVHPRAFRPVGFELLPGGVTLATFRSDRSARADA